MESGWTEKKAHELPLHGTFDCLAGPAGIEPALTVLETAVLPLYEDPIIIINLNAWIPAGSPAAGGLETAVLPLYERRPYNLKAGQL